MKKILAFVLLIPLFSLALPAQEKEVPPAPPVQAKVQEAPVKNPHSATTARAWRQASRVVDGGHFVYFMDREKMRGKDRAIHFKVDHEKKHAITLPIDWAKNIDFPMDLNDQLGDCYYAAGCHTDNTYAGNTGPPSVFSLSAIRSRYLTLSGGDNGLNDSDMQAEMMNRYLADVPAAKILSWANVDPTDAMATQLAIQKYGVVLFTFCVAPNWINSSDTGTVWDASSYRNNNNGHAVIFNGVDAKGNYKLQTWGTYVWITPAAVKVCQPGAWVAFSSRWFDPKTGYAPNGSHIVELAKQWTIDTGKTIDPAVISSFPPPGVTPPPPPTPPGPIPPTPGPVGMDTITLNIGGQTSQYELFPLGTRSKFAELQKIIGNMAP